MNKLGWYLFRQNLTAFLFATVALTAVVLFALSFRLLSLVIDNAGTLLVFLQLMGLSLPSFLPVIIPLSLGAAIIFIYHKAALDSELTVMRAAGVSPLRLAAPGIILAFCTVLFCYLLSTMLTPAANRMLVAQQYALRDNYSIFLIRPGAFNDLAKGVTFYARKRDKGGGLEDILIHDVRNKDKPVSVMAESGQMTTQDGQQQITVFNGRRQEVDRASGRLSELRFERYVVDLGILQDSDASRQPNPRELSMAELMNPPEDPALRRASLEKIAAELHQRLVLPWLPFCFALIGIAAILAGEFNRRGMAKRILLAAVAIISMQALMLWLVNLVTRYEHLAPLLYLAPIVPVLITLLMLVDHRQTTDRVTA